MKRAIILGLVFLLVLSMSSLSVADSTITIDAPITSAMNMSATDWFSSAPMRAMLTIFTSVDTINKMEDGNSDSLTALWTNPSWVGISQNNRQVIVSGYFSTAASTTVLVMIFTPSTGKIEYMPITSKPAMPSSTAEMLCEAAMNQCSSYKKNNQSDILSAISDLSAVMK